LYKGDATCPRCDKMWHTVCATYTFCTCSFRLPSRNAIDGRYAFDIDDHLIIVVPSLNETEIRLLDRGGLIQRFTIKKLLSPRTTKEDLDKILLLR